MFDDVLQAVKNWLSKELQKYDDRISVKVISDTSDNLLVNIDTEQYVGELNVSKPDFRPYRYVELYIWFDSQKSFSSYLITSYYQ